MTLHLGNAAIAVLKSLRRVNDNPYVIVGKKKRQPLTDLQHRGGGYVRRPCSMRFAFTIYDTPSLRAVFRSVKDCP